MNSKTYVKLSNVIGVVSIILLVLWVFSFILIEVFDLLIFQKNMTEIFMLSILALIAVMAGALIINIMFNLTRIADKHNIDDSTKKMSKKVAFAGLLIFPILAILLFFGDYATEKRKEEYMLRSTKSFISDSQTLKNLMDTIKFNEVFVNEIARELGKYERAELNFNDPEIIFYLNIESQNDYFKIDDRDTFTQRDLQDTVSINIDKYTEYYNKEDEEYFNKVFQQGFNKHRFIRNGKNFMLEYPFHYQGKTVIIRTSDYQRYGKYGS